MEPVTVGLMAFLLSTISSLFLMGVIDYQNIKMIRHLEANLQDLFEREWDR